MFDRLALHCSMHGHHDAGIHGWDEAPEFSDHSCLCRYLKFPGWNNRELEACSRTPRRSEEDGLAEGVILHTWLARITTDILVGHECTNEMSEQ